MLPEYDSNVFGRFPATQQICHPRRSILFCRGVYTGVDALSGYGRDSVCKCAYMFCMGNRRIERVQKIDLFLDVV